MKTKLYLTINLRESRQHSNLFSYLFWMPTLGKERATGKTCTRKQKDIIENIRNSRWAKSCSCGRRLLHRHRQVLQPPGFRFGPLGGRISHLELTTDIWISYDLDQTFFLIDYMVYHHFCDLMYETEAILHRHPATRVSRGRHHSKEMPTASDSSVAQNRYRQVSPNNVIVWRPYRDRMSF